MRKHLIAGVVLLLSLFAVRDAKAACGFNAVIQAPATVNSMWRGNVATFTAAIEPHHVTWRVDNGAVLEPGRSVIFEAGRSGTLRLNLFAYDERSTCFDTVTKDIPIVHPCIVTPKSAVVSSAYSGETVTLNVEANCSWSVKPMFLSTFVTVDGQSSFTGNGAVRLRFNPLPIDGGAQSARGRSTILFVGDKDIVARQSGWREVGTDVFRNQKADLVWRNATANITFAQALDGLTIVTSSWVIGASRPVSPAGRRIVDTRTTDIGWEIFWRDFSTSDNSFQEVLATAAYGPVSLMNRDDANWRMVGEGVFRPERREWTGGTSSYSDEIAGVVMRNLVTGAVRVRSRNGTMDSIIWHEPDPRWKIVALDDFDGDGITDVLWHNDQSGLVFMMLNPTTVGSNRVVYTEPDTNWKIITAGDVTGDAKADIVWRNSADGRVWIQAMNGFTPIGSAVVWRDADVNWRIQGMADFNGDGSKDLLWRNTSTGAVFSVLLNHNLTVQQSGVVHREPDPNWKIVAPTTTQAAMEGNSTP